MSLTVKRSRPKKCRVSGCRATFVPAQPFQTWCSPDCAVAIIRQRQEKQRAEPGLDGGFVVMAVSTRKQSQKWFSDLFELMHAFGAEHDVRWTEQDKWGGRY